jgi:starvation-inducible DNA-binding protein
MASIATSSHLPALVEPRERDAIGHELTTTPHDLLALSLIGKQLRWAVVGPLLRPLHQQLDELVDAWRDLADVVAERAVAFRYVPDGQAPAVTAASEITPVAPTPIEDHALVRELTHRIAKVSERARTRMDRLRDIDAASQDLGIEVARKLEERQWMLRARWSAERDHDGSSGRQRARGVALRVLRLGDDECPRPLHALWHGRADRRACRLHTGTRRRRTLPDLRRRGDGAGEGPRLNRVPRRSVRTTRVGLAQTRCAHANRHSTHRREAIPRRGWARLLSTAAFLRVHPKCR